MYEYVSQKNHTKIIPCFIVCKSVTNKTYQKRDRLYIAKVNACIDMFIVYEYSVC